MIEQCIIRLRTGGDFSPANTTEGPQFLAKGLAEAAGGSPQKLQCTPAARQLGVKRKRASVGLTASFLAVFLRHVSVKRFSQRRPNESLVQKFVSKTCPDPVRVIPQKMRRPSQNGDYVPNALRRAAMAGARAGGPPARPGERARGRPLVAPATVAGGAAGGCHHDRGEKRDSGGRGFDWRVAADRVRGSWRIVEKQKYRSTVCWGGLIPWALPTTGPVGAPPPAAAAALRLRPAARAAQINGLAVEQTPTRAQIRNRPSGRVARCGARGNGQPRHVHFTPPPQAPYVPRARCRAGGVPPAPLIHQAPAPRGRWGGGGVVDVAAPPTPHPRNVVRGVAGRGARYTTRRGGSQRRARPPATPCTGVHLGGALASGGPSPDVGPRLLDATSTAACHTRAGGAPRARQGRAGGVCGGRGG